MAPLDQITHLINFLAPALAVAVVLALLARLMGQKRPAAPGLFAQVAINFIVGALAMGLGLWFFGRDGKMASYGAMVVFCSISQATALRR